MSKFIDLTGQRFGRLTVIERIERGKSGKSMWKCRCDCGGFTTSNGSNLRRGKSTSCGCIGLEKAKNRRIDLTNQKFGKLTVIRISGKDKRGNITWLCKCDCGNEANVAGHRLRSEQTKSCGCLAKEKIREVSYKHGGTGTRLHNIWFAMKTRCYNKNSKIYPYYGGREIKICDEWLNDFTSFRNWSINNGYGENLSIDRIDNDGNYEPSNCRWTTQKQQSRNTRRCQMITHAGESHCMSEWAEMFEVDSSKLTGLLQRNNYDAGKVFLMISKEVF